MAVSDIKQEALGYAIPERVDLYLKFFQCYPGGYGEGDVFAGIKNPPLRQLAQKYKSLDIDDIFTLLTDEVHEIRLLALFMLCARVKLKRTPFSEVEYIAQKYLQHLKYINNWDLVDASAHHLLGRWVYESGADEVVYNLAKSNNFWENRMAIISTFYHISNNEFRLALNIAEKLLHHKHDLIHKGVGWMLREIGKRDLMAELAFLSQYYKTMPRTMLRYAIEKFDEPMRQSFLKGTFSINR